MTKLSDLYNVGTISSEDMDMLLTNQAIGAFDTAVQNNLSAHNIANGWVDTFVDESRVDTGASSNQVYNSSGEYYDNTSWTIDNHVAQYKLNDDAANTTVANTEGTDGTASTNTSNMSVTGQINKAFDFESANSEYVDCNQSFESTFQSAFTFSFWAKPDDGQPGSRQQFCGTATGDVDDMVAARLETDGTITVSYESNASVTCRKRTDSPVFSDGSTSWKLIQIEYSPSDIKIYVDTAEVNSSWENGDIANVTMGGYANSNNLLIGELNRDSGTEGDYYNGLLDDFRLFSDTLTSDERDNIYNSGSGTEKQTGDPTDMTLISTSQSASFDPDEGRLILRSKHIDSVTLNTDLKGYISQDGGTSWDQIPLAQAGTYGDLVVLEGDASLAYSGTSILWKLVTANTKEIQIHDIAPMWGADRDGTLSSGDVTEEEYERLQDSDALLRFEQMRIDSLTTQDFIDGFADAYEDESGIDTAGSTNQVYDATGDYYTNTSWIIDNHVAQYKMNDDAADTTVTNEEGTDGTASTNTSNMSVTGQINKAFDFESANSEYVDTNQPFESTFQSAFTVSFWAKPDDGHPSLRQWLFGTTTGNIDDAVYGILRTDGTLRVGYESNTTTANKVTDAAVFSDGSTSWKLIQFECSPSDIKIYVDTAEVNSSWDGGDISNATMGNYVNSNSLYIGDGHGDSGNRDEYYNGLLDDFRLFSDTLTSDERDNIYNSGSGTEKQTGDPTDMTLLSSLPALDTEPTEARLIGLINPVNAITLNTDLKGYVTKDGGSTWDQATLEKVGDYGGKILVADTVSLSSSGTDMEYKWETANSKEIQIHATAELGD